MGVAAANTSKAFRAAVSHFIFCSRWPFRCSTHQARSYSASGQAWPCEKQQQLTACRCLLSQHQAVGTGGAGRRHCFRPPGGQGRLATGDHDAPLRLSSCASPDPFPAADAGRIAQGHRSASSDLLEVDGPPSAATPRSATHISKLLCRLFNLDLFCCQLGLRSLELASDISNLQSNQNSRVLTVCVAGPLAAGG